MKKLSSRPIFEQQKNFVIQCRANSWDLQKLQSHTLPHICHERTTSQINSHSYTDALQLTLTDSHSHISWSHTHTHNDLLMIDKTIKTQTRCGYTHKSVNIVFIILHPKGKTGHFSLLILRRDSNRHLQDESDESRCRNNLMLNIETLNWEDANAGLYILFCATFLPVLQSQCAAFWIFESACGRKSFNFICFVKNA